MGGQLLLPVSSGSPQRRPTIPKKGGRLSNLLGVGFLCVASFEMGSLWASEFFFLAHEKQHRDVGKLNLDSVWLTSSSNVPSETNMLRSMKQENGHQTNNAESADLLNSYKEVERASSRGFSALPLENQSLEEITDSLDEAAPTWKKFPVVQPVQGPKQVLVTGAAGFIGSHVADFLLARGDSVVVVDEVNDFYDVAFKESNLSLLKSKYGEDRLVIHRGDICDEAFMTRIFETEQPKWVCHMAARAGVRPSINDPYVYIHSNIRGTTLLMDLSVKYQVQNFVLASSSSVYGNSKSAHFAEDDIVDHPVSPYAATKKACELLAYTYHHLYKLNVTGLRFFTVYGPRGRPDMAPYKFIHLCSNGLTIQQFGDGSTSRDYTYIDDIVDGVVRAIDRPYAYQLFNLGKGDGTSLKEFLNLVEKYVGKPAIIEILPEQPGDVRYTSANVNKAAHLLGYKSKIPLDEGIRRTVEWYKEYRAKAPN